MAALTPMLIVGALLIIPLYLGLDELHQAQRIDHLRVRPGTYRAELVILDHESHCAKSCSYTVSGFYTPHPGAEPDFDDQQDATVYPDYDRRPYDHVEVLVSPTDPTHALQVGASSRGRYNTALVCFGIVAGVPILWIALSLIKRHRRRRATAA